MLVKKYKSGEEIPNYKNLDEDFIMKKKTFTTIFYLKKIEIY